MLKNTIKNTHLRYNRKNISEMMLGLRKKCENHVLRNGKNTEPF